MAKILIAEDDAHVMRLLSIWLERNGHEIHEARNGCVAREYLGVEEIDCVVTDINMPQMDGIQLVHWIRDEAKLSVPVIMLSARCDQVRIGQMLQDYRVGFHPKPFSPSRLITEIEELLESAQPIGS